MVVVQVCVGSSCHLKGSEKIVELLQKYVAEGHYEDDVVLTGSFCTGRCNRLGVTVTVDDEAVTGVTEENFKEFWNDKVLKKLGKDEL